MITILGLQTPGCWTAKARANEAPGARSVPLEAVGTDRADWERTGLTRSWPRTATRRPSAPPVALGVRRTSW
jgi:hypothetical protein